MSNLSQIATAIQMLSRAFEEAKLGAPEIVVSYDDLCALKAMTGSMQFMYATSPGPNTICGVVVRTKEKPLPLYTYVKP